MDIQGKVVIVTGAMALFAAPDYRQRVQNPGSVGRRAIEYPDGTGCAGRGPTDERKLCQRDRLPEYRRLRSASDRNVPQAASRVRQARSAEPGQFAVGREVLPGGQT